MSWFRIYDEGMKRFYAIKYVLAATQMQISKCHPGYHLCTLKYAPGHEP